MEKGGGTLRTLRSSTAPTAGSGKNLLVEVTSVVATGRPALPVSAPRDDEEMRKRITAQLRRGTPIIVLDNIKMCVMCVL